MQWTPLMQHRKTHGNVCACLYVCEKTQATCSYLWKMKRTSVHIDPVVCTKSLTQGACVNARCRHWVGLGHVRY